ncbi:MAG: hypothetical protein JSV56_13130 [Methanomassiliicoccales archaeon]|nr:MAG: hypothetical protein JSV56_13130 [Methanomassiliicoccales archaeon]
MLKLEEIFNALNDANIKYLLIGGMASILYGVPRTTLDFDIAISSSKENVAKTIETMKNLGLSCDTENIEDILAQGGITFSKDMEVDVITDMPGKNDFMVLWERRESVIYEGIMINVISKDDQIRILREVGRKQDIEDANILSRDGL